MVDAAVLLVAIVIVLTLHFGAIVSAARRPHHAYRAIGRTRPGTILMIVLTGFIGGIYFLLRIRPELLRAEMAIPADSLPPPDHGDRKQWRRTRDPWA